MQLSWQMASRQMKSFTASPLLKVSNELSQKNGCVHWSLVYMYARCPIKFCFTLLNGVVWIGQSPIKIVFDRRSGNANTIKISSLCNRRWDK